LLYVGIQREPPLLDQPHRAERKDRLAYRSGQEKGIRIDRIGLASRANAKPALPRHPAVIDDSYGDSRRFIVRHPFAEWTCHRLKVNQGRRRA
jgi:hypothetical protein